MQTARVSRHVVMDLTVMRNASSGVVRGIPEHSVVMRVLARWSRSPFSKLISLVGKFQMVVLPKSGHAVQEDQPVKVAEALATFMVRHKFVKEAITTFPP